MALISTPGQTIEQLISLSEGLRNLCEIFAEKVFWILNSFSPKQK